jgi:hypothetical protein
MKMVSIVNLEMLKLKYCKDNKIIQRIYFLGPANRESKRSSLQASTASGQPAY